MKASYGTIRFEKANKNYQVSFYNPILKKTENTEYFKEKDEAKNKIAEWNFSFFSENPTFLPKGISVIRRDKRYVFSVQIKKKTISVFSSKDLDEVYDFKFKFAQSFLS